MATRELDLTQRSDIHSKGHLSRAWSRLIRKKIAVACIVTLGILYSAGIFAEVISPYGYRDQDFTAFNQSPSLQHWAGTDRAGRDVLTRVIWGIQNTIIITVVSMATGGIAIGISLGLISGYFGRWIDTVIMRIGEIFSSFPEILLIIILAATLRPRILDLVRWIEDHSFVNGLVNTGIADYIFIMLALVSFGWIGMARLVRGQVLFLRETQYVDSARASGASNARVMFIHILPNAISPIIVTVSMGMGALVGLEIMLSFLGLGIQPPRPSLGTMLLETGNIGTLRTDPWRLLAPGLVAWSLILAWNLLGDALNDVLNPRTR